MFRLKLTSICSPISIIPRLIWLSNTGVSRKMFEVTVLFEGYSRTEEGGSVMHANCTCTLVRGEGITAIVDTRTAWDGEEITEALKKGPCIYDFRQKLRSSGTSPSLSAFGTQIQYKIHATSLTSSSLGVRLSHMCIFQRGGWSAMTSTWSSARTATLTT